MNRNLHVSLKRDFVAKAPTGEEYVKWRDRVRKKSIRKRLLVQKQRSKTQKPVILEPVLPSSDSLRWRGEPWKIHQQELLRIQREIYNSTILHDPDSLTHHQLELLHSSSARSLAIRRICTTHPQRRESGVDGLHSLKEVQQRRLSSTLEMECPSDPFLFKSVSPSWKALRKSKEQDVEICVCTVRERVRQVIVAWILIPQLEALFLSTSIFGHRPGRGISDFILWLSHHLAIEKFYLTFSLKIEDPVLVASILRAELSVSFGSLISSWCDEGLLKLGLYPRGLGRQGHEQACPILPFLSNFISYKLIQKLNTSLSISTYNGTFIAISDTKSELHKMSSELREVLGELGLGIEFFEIGQEIEFLQFEIKDEKLKNGVQRRVKMRKGVLDHHLRNLGMACHLSEEFHEDKSGLINRLNPIIESFANHFHFVDCFEEFEKADGVLKELLMVWAIVNNPRLSTGEALEKEFNGTQNRDLGFGFQTRIARIQRHEDFRRKRPLDEVELLSPFSKDTSKWTRKLKKWEIDLCPALVHLQ